MIFKAEPRHFPGDKQLIRKFALFPIRCYANHYHWLEYVEFYRVWVYGEGWIKNPCSCSNVVKY